METSHLSVREEHQSHNIPASEPSTYWKWWVPLVCKWSGIGNRNMVKVDLSLQPRRATWSRWSTWRMRCIVSNEHGVATRAFGSSDSLRPKAIDFANALKSVFWSRRSGDENTLLMISYGSTRFLSLSFFTRYCFSRSMWPGHWILVQKLSKATSSLHLAVAIIWINKKAHSRALNHLLRMGWSLLFWSKIGNVGYLSISTISD